MNSRSCEIEPRLQVQDPRTVSQTIRLPQNASITRIHSPGSSRGDEVVAAKNLTFKEAGDSLPTGWVESTYSLGACVDVQSDACAVKKYIYSLGPK